MTPTPNSNLPHIRVVAAEIEQNGEYLITQRRPEAALPLLWEFPGGRVQEGESDSDALRRTIRHRLDVGVQVGHRVLHVTHTYDKYALDMIVYRCALVGQPRAANVHQINWVRPDAFGQYPFPGADQQTVDALLAGT